MAPGGQVQRGGRIGGDDVHDRAGLCAVDLCAALTAASGLTVALRTDETHLLWIALIGLVVWAVVRPVHSMAAADRAAGRFADRWYLHVGEVMQCSNGYYAELLAPDGSYDARPPPARTPRQHLRECARKWGPSFLTIHLSGRERRGRRVEAWLKR